MPTLVAALRPLLVLGVLALSVVLGLQRGLGSALLLLAGGALVLTIAFLWQSVQGLDEDEAPLTLEEALGLAAPSAEEERKRAALRALSDLEYERSVGKIAEADYAALSGLYRAEARQLLAREDRDDAALLARVEERLARALREAAPAATPAVAPDEPAADRERDPAEARPAPRPPQPPEAERRPCDGCQTVNDPDARFCKRCGADLEAAS